MVKKQKRAALVYLALGLAIALIAAFIHGDDYNTGILSGIGTSLVAVGLLRLLKLYRLARTPEQAADYEASGNDERVRYIVTKARAVAFVTAIFAQLAAGLTAQLVFNQRLIGMVLCYCTCFQCLLFVVVYYYYSRKY